jgi:hypothetical protein
MREGPQYLAALDGELGGRECRLCGQAPPSPSWTSLHAHMVQREDREPEDGSWCSSYCLFSSLKASLVAF